MPNKSGPRPAKEVVTDALCECGCGTVARYQNRSGKFLCKPFPNSCPAIRAKNSNGLKTCGRDYSDRYKSLSQDTKDKMAWAKGHTKSTHPSIAKQASTVTGRRRTTNEERLHKIIYREQCEFNLAGCIERIPGFDLLKQSGMYSRGKNLDGVVRDHRISIDYGYKNNIDPKIISHPANCRFISHRDNARKTKKCEITLEQLLEDIKVWDNALVGELVDPIA